MTHAESGNLPRRKSILIGRLVLSAYLTVVLAGWQIGSLHLWGTWHLAFLPASVSWMLLVVSLCVTWVPVPRSRRLKSIAWAENASGLMQVVAATVFLIAIAALFALARFDNVLLGDSYRLVNASDLLSLSSPAEYLTLLLHQLLYSLSGSMRLAYRIADVFAGMLFVFVLMEFSRRLFDKFVDRVVCLAIGLSIGSVQFFFGYIENYAMMTSFTGLFLLAGWYSINRAGRFWLPVLALAAATAFHLTAAFMAPGLIYLLWAACPDRRRRVCRFAATGLAISIAAAAVVFYSHSGVSDILVPVLPVEGNPYSLFSLQHILDVVNLILLIAPAPVIVTLSGLLAIGPRALLSGKETVFLAVSLLGSLLLPIAIDPKLGAARDWDLMSLFGTPAAFLAMALWRKEGADHLRVRTIGAVAVVALLVHTIPWVLSNRDRQLAVNRFKDLIRSDIHYSGEYFDGDRLMAWGLMMGDAYGDHAEKERAFKLRVSAKPDDQRSWLILDRAYFDQNKNEESREALEHVTNYAALSREQLTYYIRAMLHYGDGGNAVKALSAYAAKFDPDYDYFYLSGLAEQLRGDHAAACRFYSRAAEAREPDIDLLVMYCTAAFEIGDRDLGMTLLSRAEKLSVTREQDEELKSLREAYHAE